MIALFTSYIYQPFFNILVGLYWVVSQFTPTPNMGWAVILFAVAVRFVLLPFNLLSSQSANEKKAVIKQIKKLEEKYRGEPVKFKKAKKQLLKSNPIALLSELMMITIQVIIILMLYRLFNTGLTGPDFHLTYDFMPSIKQPVNLVFLDQYDLTKPSFFLNLFQSLTIMAFEALSLFYSPSKASRQQFVSTVIMLPLVSFVLFMFLPAGKLLFITTSLFFSIALLIVKETVFWYYSLVNPKVKKA